MIDPTVVVAGLPVLAGWIWWVDRKVSSHEEVIKKMDQLIQVLLEDRLQRPQEPPRRFDSWR